MDREKLIALIEEMGFIGAGPVKLEHFGAWIALKADLLKKPVKLVKPKPVPVHEAGKK